MAAHASQGHQIRDHQYVVSFQTSVWRGQGGTVMKMLTIACRDSLVDEVWAVLMKSGVKGYTLLGKAVGRGETDPSPPPLNLEGQTNLLLVVLPEKQMTQVLDGLTALHDQLAQHRHEVPLRVFAQPCEVLL
jgi:hypothetical protein